MSHIKGCRHVGCRGLSHLIANADQQTKVHLLMLDVWGEVCLGTTAQSTMLDKLHQHVSVVPL